jgi:hypothetical protein
MIYLILSLQDPHPGMLLLDARVMSLSIFAGNLLIRPAPITSRSPYNFEIVLLDHGQYFDLDLQLRVNYSRLLISLILPASKEVIAERRKYAEAVGNIGPDLVRLLVLLTDSVLTNDLVSGIRSRCYRQSCFRRNMGR